MIKKNEYSSLVVCAFVPINSMLAALLETSSYRKHSRCDDDDGDDDCERV